MFEILTPIVREIRSLMINKNIPDYYYYSKIIINGCLLRCRNENISWKISNFNRNNPQFYIHSINLNQLLKIMLIHYALIMRYYLNFYV